MKTKRKSAIIVILLVAIMCLGVPYDASETAYAKTLPTSGEFYGIKWEYDEATKTLTITGKGKMHDYIGDIGEDVSDECPWWDYCDVTEKIIINDGITHIGGMAFDHFYEVTSVSIPGSVSSIGYDAFDSCDKLSSITLPKNLKTIKMGVFTSCLSLKEITIPDSVTSMGKWSLAECDKLSSVKLPKNIKTLPEGIFRNCPKLKSVKIPKAVTVIGANAFENSGIQAITIPKNVTTLKSEIFLNCKYLKTITIESDKITKVSKGAFKGITDKTVIQVPKKQFDIYKDMFYKAGLSKKVTIISLDQAELG